jgi:phage baseplate assembly protein W
MDAGKLLGRGISFPPRLGPDGRWAWSEGDENIRDSVRVVLMTNRNERLMLPEFGGNLGPFLFEPNTATTRNLIADRIAQALAAWESRVQVESVSVEEDPQDPRAAVAVISYRLVATESQERIALQVSLAS